ncbi:MAG: hypothetical protein DMF84_09285 [Acidobacteria bacterium]|nr:MAG: hypothetical protein DMF84_09285 [Acidobacteriota bacterium]
MNVLRAVSLGFCLAVVLPSNAMAQGTLIPPNSKVFLQHIDGFGTDLLAALIGANVPVVIVTDRMDADLEIGGRKQQRNRSASYASDLIDEATITITDIHTATVIDAFTLTAATRDKLARACANRLNDRIAIPKPTEAPRVSTPAPSEAEPVQSSPSPATIQPSSPPAAANSIRLFVQGDFNRLADFTETLRANLHALGMPIRVVQRGEEYDYNIIFALDDTNASAAALDRQGVLVASVIDSGFRAKGVSEGAARKLAKRMASFKRD